MVSQGTETQQKTVSGSLTFLPSWCTGGKLVHCGLLKVLSGLRTWTELKLDRASLTLSMQPFLSLDINFHDPLALLVIFLYCWVKLKGVGIFSN
jgi:hypothetical protein